MNKLFIYLPLGYVILGWTIFLTCLTLKEPNYQALLILLLCVMLMKYYLFYAIKYVKQHNKEEIEWKEYIAKLKKDKDIDEHIL
tara:strand:- start:293 stop:544 length:252 start_codon:yes stop_codon:yes gene_type:complete